MYRDGPVEPHILASVFEFAFYIESDSFIQRIQLWRSLIRSNKGCDDLLAPPPESNSILPWPCSGILR